MLQVERTNLRGQRLDRLLPGKPSAVPEVKVQRKWGYFIRFNFFCLEVALDGVLVEWIEMPIGSRPQKHTFRHIGTPEIHRLSDDRVFDTFASRVSRHRYAEGPGTNDEQRHGFCHGDSTFFSGNLLGLKADHQMRAMGFRE